MENKKKRSNKNYLLFISLILLITIGFALLTQDLFIRGSSQLKDSKWNIHWDNIQVNSNSVSGTSVTQAAQITNTEKTLVEYSITLSKPGEFYEFTVDAKNEGTIDGMVNTVSNKVYESNGTTEKTLPAYLTYSVTYSDGKAIASKQLLSAGSTEKYKVRVEFKDVAASQLPTQNETLKFKFEVEYVQADDSAQTIRLTGTRYTTNKWNSTYGDDSYVLIGKKPTDNITLYNTAGEAKAALSNIPFYLKHELENDIVKESYVCFEKNSNTYCLRGFKTYDIDAGEHIPEYYDSEKGYGISPYYESNKTILKNAFGASNCTDYFSWFNCSAGGWSAYAREYGNVYVSDGVSYCHVGDYARSLCHAYK